MTAWAWVACGLALMLYAAVGVLRMTAELVRQWWKID